MAEVRLTDVIVPELFLDYWRQTPLDKLRLLDTGVAAPDPQLTTLLAGGGRAVDVPNWEPVDTSDEEDTTNDDPADLAVPSKVGSALQRTPRIQRHKSWKAMDFTALLAGSDPMSHIASQVAGYWRRRREVAMYTLLGMTINDSVTNHSGDMLEDVYADIASPTAANKISASAIRQAVSTSGDRGVESYTAILMHSDTFFLLDEQDEINFAPVSEQGFNMPFYKGMAVFVDDNVTVEAGTNATAYYTYLLGSAAFRTAEASPSVPVALTREEDEGNGGGSEKLHTREEYAIHPYGYIWTGDTASNIDNPTNAQLASLTNYARATGFDRKRIKIAAVKHNV